MLAFRRWRGLTKATQGIPSLKAVPGFNCWRVQNRDQRLPRPGAILVCEAGGGLSEQCPYPAAALRRPASQGNIAVEQLTQIFGRAGAAPLGGWHALNLPSSVAQDRKSV